MPRLLLIYDDMTVTVTFIPSFPVRLFSKQDVWNNRASCKCGVTELLVWVSSLKQLFSVQKSTYSQLSFTQNNYLKKLNY